jgi:hypothetical protein
LQNRGFSARLRDSGFVLYLGSHKHFGKKSPASQMREPLWASFYKFEIEKVESRNHFKKRGVTEKPYE